MKKRPPHGREAEPGSGKSRPAKGSAFHPDDIALWHHTTRSVAPLKKAKARVPEIGAAPEVRPKLAPVADKSRPAAASPTGAKPVAAPRAALAKSPPPKSPPPLVPIERRKARRIARGHVEIDARLDLHGLRQADAERRLRTFLLRARADGLRTVLIITGKGSERDAGDESSLHDRGARGVLRRSVPLWLEAPELRDCVAGIAPAHIRHGGSGALYIHLRKPRGR
jgi:DNA-nicking Smr family endonuclease